MSKVPKIQIKMAAADLPDEEPLAPMVKINLGNFVE